MKASCRSSIIVVAVDAETGWVDHERMQRAAPPDVLDDGRVVDQRPQHALTPDDIRVTVVPLFIHALSENFLALVIRLIRQRGELHVEARGVGGEQKRGDGIQMRVNLVRSGRTIALVHTMEIPAAILRVACQTIITRGETGFAHFTVEIEPFCLVGRDSHVALLTARAESSALVLSRATTRGGGRGGSSPNGSGIVSVACGSAGMPMRGPIRSAVGDCPL